MLKKILFLSFVIFMSLGLMSAIGYAESNSNHNNHKNDNNHNDHQNDDHCDGGKCPKPPKASNHTPFTTFENNTHKETTFELKDETPFVYLRLKHLDKKEDLSINYVWTHGTDTYKQTETYSDIASLKNWQSLDIWNSVRAVGDWTVITSWGYLGKGCDMITKTSRFSVVTPEPVSMILFGLGAGVLGLSRLRRKKK